MAGSQSHTAVGAASPACQPTSKLASAARDLTTKYPLGHAAVPASAERILQRNHWGSGMPSSQRGPASFWSICLPLALGLSRGQQSRSEPQLRRQINLWVGYGDPGARASVSPGRWLPSTKREGNGDVRRCLKACRMSIPLRTFRFTEEVRTTWHALLTVHAEQSPKLADCPGAFRRRWLAEWHGFAATASRMREPDTDLARAGRWKGLNRRQGERRHWLASEIWRNGEARDMTRRRGENWPKPSSSVVSCQRGSLQSLARLFVTDGVHARVGRSPGNQQPAPTLGEWTEWRLTLERLRSVQTTSRDLGAVTGLQTRRHGKPSRHFASCPAREPSS
ncbi:hypothetical protein Purlil1_6073 [Purpureocillium lilacinum]|uniref:Uncharacterized protein n=1 Tax=Purpureocillium lilacinum TaxID=33203 RepID=A0ABR0BZI0_PURLI|nr:hypothetical protein Purlil1_6073 [Purpureocillium lilacinum]